MDETGPIAVPSVGKSLKVEICISSGKTLCVDCYPLLSDLPVLIAADLLPLERLACILRNRCGTVGCVPAVITRFKVCAIYGHVHKCSPALPRVSIPLSYRNLRDAGFF